MKFEKVPFVCSIISLSWVQLRKESKRLSLTTLSGASTQNGVMSSLPWSLEVPVSVAAGMAVDMLRRRVASLTTTKKFFNTVGEPASHVYCRSLSRTTTTLCLRNALQTIYNFIANFLITLYSKMRTTTK